MTRDDTQLTLGGVVREEPRDARPRAARPPTPGRVKPFVGGYAVAVMCRDEQHQQEVFDELKAAGHTLKVLTL